MYMKVKCTERKQTNKQFGGVGIGFWSWKRMMRMQGQLLSQISGSLSGGLPVAASGAPGRRPYWNEVLSPRLLATPDIWVCVCVCACVECLGWRVGACVSAQRPNCLRSPATSPPSSTPTHPHPPSIGPCFSFAYSFKSRKCLLRSNMGLRQGARVGPQQGWKTQQQHDEEKEEVESEGERWRMPGPPTGDGFKWLPCSLSSFHSSSSLRVSLSLCLHSVCPFFCLFSPFLCFSSLMLCSLG